MEAHTSVDLPEQRTRVPFDMNLVQGAGGELLATIALDNEPEASGYGFSLKTADDAGRDVPASAQMPRAACTPRRSA
jgi:hypothetical protein